MPRISLNTATALTGISKRTLWRRIADGLLRTMDPEKRGERAQLDLDEVLPMACIPLASDDIALVVAADAGEAEAQCDLALLFLKAGRPTGALYWLELAAAQSYPEAMYWLGRCHVSGGGVPRDENIGISWLARAASHGHVIAREQMQALQGRNGQAVAPLASGGGGLDGLLEAIEKRVVADALRETANPPAASR